MSEENGDFAVGLAVVLLLFVLLAMGPSIFAYILICVAIMYLLVRS